VKICVNTIEQEYDADVGEALTRYALHAAAEVRPERNTARDSHDDRYVSVASAP